MKKVILTGDRPTGKLHIGHYAGSLRQRVAMQNSGEYDVYIMIADQQALTDNAKDPAKIRENILEVALDYLSVGLDPTKSTIFIQSQIPALYELTIHYQNLVHLGRLQRNPTIKTEIKERGFEKSIPVGFLTYPIAQAADITAFNANLVPVGEDQLPILEQDREIVRAFNQLYGDILVEPEAVLTSDEKARRLPGLRGIDDKMSKSLNNGIYLSDSPEIVQQKVMEMFTDPDHIRVDDPGKIEGNVVFYYLDVFAPDDPKVAEIKEHYQRGGLGDVVVKKYLIGVLEKILAPIRMRREELAKDPAAIYEILKQGSEKASNVANETLQKVRDAIGISYFDKSN
ncbi:tryptophan--tRNA ligase [Candidatus Saccharibacteria bacterium]|nr:tryptophan--tRNA ligase [Candidatus Saccharibacteria bacterium]